MLSPPLINFILTKTLGAELEKLKGGDGKASMGRQLHGHLGDMTSARAPRAWA